MEIHLEKKYTFDAGAQLMAGRGSVQNPGATDPRKHPFDADTLQVEKKYTVKFDIIGIQKMASLSLKQHSLRLK